MKHNRSLLVLAASMGTVTLAGCGASPLSGAASPATSAPVVIALPVETSPNWFFPVFSTNTFSATNIELDALMYKPLLDVTPQDTVDYKHSLVSSITWNKSATIFTLTMNPRYHWSNGHPVTARDVAFTWSIMKAASSNAKDLPWNYGGEGSGGVPADFKSVTAVNSRTLRVSLTAAVNPQWLILNGLGQINPVPASVWNKHPHNLVSELRFIEAHANSPTSPLFKVVDGAYQFGHVQPNQSWSFVANKNYGGRLSSISSVVFQYETSSTSEFSALKTGALTVGYLPLSLWKSRGELTHDQVIPGYVWGMTYLQPNESAAAPNGSGLLFHQLYVRQALAYGINQPAIIQAFYHGNGIMEDGPIPQKPATPYYNTALNTPVYPFNPPRGKALLLSHGWHDHGGIMTKDGKPLTFTLNYNAGSQTVTDIAQLLKSDWAQEGVQVNLVSTPFDSLIAMPANKWSMIWLGLGSWIYSPDYYPTGGALFKTDAALNGEDYSNPTMNSLIDKTYSPYTSTTQEFSRLDSYQAFAAHHIPVIWMPYAASDYVVSDSLHGYQHSMNLVSGLIYPNMWRER